MGLRIRELRMERGMTQESMAERLDMITSNYAKIEQGRVNVTVTTAVHVANGLGVEVGDLFQPPTIKKARPGRPPKRR
jgi:transcriptional regulator with XRE-family HTH domain